MTRARRRISIGLAVAVALAAGWTLLRPDAVPVDVAPVVRGQLRVTVDEEGETRVRDRFTITAPTAGRLLRSELDAGDAVEPGTLLASIEPLPLDARTQAGALARLEAAEATLHAARARVALAGAALEQARRAATRAEQLREKGTLSDEAHEQALLELTRHQQETAAARFAADAAEHDAEAARAALLAAPDASAPPARGGGRPPPTSRLEVRSPAAGRVLRVLEESERIIAAGTPLLEIGDPDSLELVIDVLSTDAVRIRPGARVIVKDWGGDGALEARVRRVEPSGFKKVSALGVEEQRVNVIADLAEPNPALGDGYRFEAMIVVWEGPGVLQVPASALFRQAGAWSVFVVEGRRARRREVTVGQRGGYAAEIRDGLAPGETVVLYPSDRLEDGVRIRAVP
ncbi:MAG: efflux RND transporter periplasmic adaptor subunit [Candidatus Limnocylindria bacterium]